MFNVDGFTDQNSSVALFDTNLI